MFRPTTAAAITTTIAAVLINNNSNRPFQNVDYIVIPETFSKRLQYVGCYHPASAKDRGFPVKQNPVAVRTNSVENCVKFCRGKGYTYAGMQV